MIVEEGEFKGHKILIFKKDEKEKYPVSFGLRKIKIILENIEHIKAFYTKYRQDDEPPE